ncbi:hypothetical protein G4Z16_08385 [Streptomyces bathyalis]|uniref:GHMP kinase N-terminal domain-containing protein n=1 Tax=Streptomyces bathyalis TaxID=2710756 RepID=A0A7T1T4U9_9ACTN|nr:hypothetical protein [Streptomyces bathyalis]QPP06412.1 hypothetical protein G4Z16_08385 [Streptomyces bathyalis]
MATETKTEKTAAKQAETDNDKKTAGKAEETAVSEDTRAEVLQDDGSADEVHVEETVLVNEAPRGGLGAGAGAVVSAAFGLASITGTSLSEMLRDRKQLIGQIESSAQGQQGGGGADQITALYGAPWHATALLNGIFAVIAVLVGGVLLGLVAKRAETASWVKAVALGGVILGVIGLVVAGGMYLDLFAPAPEMPAAPPTPPAQ